MWDRPAPLTVLYMDVGREWRGGQRQILWMGDGLRRRAGRPIFALRPGAPLATYARERGIEVIPIDPTLAEAGPWTVLRLRRLIRREGIHILHPQSGHTLGLAALARPGTDARIVFARRTVFPLRHNAGTRWKYQRADAVIAVSRAALTLVTEMRLDPARLHVIPDGVDLDRCIASASDAVLAQVGVPARAPLVVMVAALVPHKDPLTFVRAIAAARRVVPALHALLVGNGPLAGAVRREIDALGVAGVLHATGYRADADALVAAADVVALSSAQEGLGTVLLDAMALGKPIVATRAGGIPELVLDGETGLLAPAGDWAALGGAIAHLLTHPTLAARLAAAGRMRAAEFSIERTVARTMAVYEQVLTGRRAA